MLLSQLTGLLGDAPTLLNDCLRSSFQPGDMKAVLEHNRELGHFKEKGGIFRAQTLIYPFRPPLPYL